MAFTYRVTKEQKVLIAWDHQLVVTLAGAQARTFLRQMDRPGADPQQIMARFTGNFKRGNERDGKHTPKRGDPE